MIIKPQFSDGILSEYPRPQMKRESYFCLNGEWEFAFTSTESAPEQYDGTILVPFSPESPLSGVNRQLKKTEYLHYRKIFCLPDKFMRERLLLNIGACDQICQIYLNGIRVGEHRGGYLPFTADLTDSFRAGKNELHIVVRDDADSDVYGRGKQSYQNGGIWYTAISGIWQTVWMESVPKIYLRSYRIYPNIQEKKVVLQFETSAPGAEISVKLLSEGTVLSEARGKNKELVLDASGCELWSPEAPHLYSLEITVGEDVVTGYCALRSFHKVRLGDFMLCGMNGKPIFLNGLLDQGYWGEGIYTPRNNRQMYELLENVKHLGFNMLRKHIKVEPLLWYYYCDILGIVVWQDMVNGGKKYSDLRLKLGPFINLHLNDRNYRSMGRDNPASRTQFLMEAEEEIDALFNCVCIALWTPFNEGWGQFDAIKVWERLKRKDPTRLFDHASGWQDKGGGDLCSKHIYFKKIRLKNDGKRILALTEFGGYAFHAGAKKKVFAYKFFGNADAYSAALKNLYLLEIIPAIRQGLSAIVYTQLNDIEEETNGIFTDSFTLKLPAEKLTKLSAALQKEFNALYKPSR